MINDSICLFLHLIHIKIRMEEVGKHLKERRNQLGITQLDLADLAGISANTLYKIERGQANPTLKVISKLADVLGMELKLEVKKIE
ncbi:MAG TPA: helix-turn-helix transcriptional regulator [Bacteroidales bacterium]|nr:helix-turn-helix transcriptional regulator [Bacteroidales bacterium]